MKMSELAVSALAGAARALNPLVLAVDFDGVIRDRIAHQGDRIPADFASAPSLDAVLAAPVCAAWLDLVRETMARREGIGSLAILDGRGHALAFEPDDSPEGGVMLVIFPAPMCVGHSPAIQGRRFIPLLRHEWGCLECLSRGQLDTLRSVTLGLTNDGIAAGVHRTKRAIEWHIRFLNQLLGTQGREQLSVIGRRAGLSCFTDEAWQRILESRPSRRDATAPEPMLEPKPLWVA